jgi:hypothetical protein
LAAAPLGEWDWLAHICSFFRDDIRIDLDQTKENRAWMLLLAGVLRGREWNDMQHFIDQIRQGLRKRERLLLDLLESILFKQQAEIDLAANSYFKYYKKSELPKHDLTLKLALDATVLVHYANHIGKQVTVSPEMEDHIVRL